MTERKVLFKKECAYAQAPDMVSVKQLMIVGENGKKYLALRLVNERSEPVSALDIDITELDGDGRIIARTTLDIEVSGGAGEIFVPDQRIELEDGTCDCVVTVARATFGAYVYRAVKNKAVVEYGGVKHDEELDDGKKCSVPAVKDGISVKPRKLKIPVLVVFAMIISLVFTAFAAYLHMLFFMSTETTFLHNGVEYAFANDDSSPGTDIYAVGFYGGRARIVIPKEIGGHPVVGIGDEAFKGDSSLVSISFEGELPVGRSAFEDCVSLKEVEFEKITAIGASAFRSCIMLDSVTVRADITRVPEDAFYGCENLATVTFEQSAEPVALGLRVFADCKKLKSVEFLRRIDYGGKSRSYFPGAAVERMHLLNFDLSGNADLDVFGALFGAQKSPESVNVGELTIDYLENIPANFLQNVPLTAFTVKYAESSVVGDKAFYGCNMLSRFDFPVAVSGAGSRAFYGTALTEFDGTGLTSVGERVFGGCTRLAAVDFTGNNALRQLSMGMFEDCSALTRITLPANVTSIPSRAFYGCESLYDVRVAGEGSVSEVAPNAFENCKSLTRLPDFGESFYSIGDRAFANCTGLANFVVPDSVRYIGLGAFAGCSSVKSITVPFVGSAANGGNGFLAYIFGGSSYINTSAVPASLNTVTVTGGTTLFPNAFNGLTGLTTIVLPDTLTRIGSAAFCNCSGLADIKLPDGLDSIGSEAFRDCTGLTEIVIPDSVTAIEFRALAGCSKLEKISMPYAVSGVSLHFGYIFGAESADRTSGFVNANLKSITVTSGRVIPADAFRGLMYVEEIILPDTLAFIGDRAFYFCRSLKSLVIPDGVTEIGMGALLYTDSLQALSIPFVGARRCTGTMYYYDFSLTAAYLYSEYGDGSYMQPSRELKTVKLTDSNFISPNAFGGFTHIEKVVLDCDVKAIADDAFTSCYALYEVFNGSSLELVVGAAGNGGISEHVLAVHGSVDAAPLEQVRTDDGYRFVYGDGAWHLIDFPIEIISENRSEISLPVTVSAEDHSFGTYRIWRYLFANSCLETVFIPDSVTYIGDYAFAFNSLLEKAEFSARSPITELAEGLFAYDRMLADVVLPSGLRKIDALAFVECSRIKKLTIGEKLQSIGSEAFYGCNRLFEVYNNSSLQLKIGGEDFGRIAFNARKVYSREEIAQNPNVALPTVISGGVQYIRLNDDDTAWWAVDYYGEDGVLELMPFTYNGSVVKSVGIYDGAFADNGNITKLIIGNVVNRLGAQFTFCYNVADIEIVNNGGEFDGIAIDSFALGLPKLKTVKASLPVTELASDAFSAYGDYLNNLTSVSFSDVDTVRSNAFSGLVSMCGLEFGDIRVIEQNAFSGRDSITSFKAGSVGQIGDYAFSGCSSLKSVEFGKTGSIGDYAFSSCYNMTSAKFERVESVGASAFIYCNALKSFAVADASAELKVGDRAFDRCISLEKFEYGGSVELGDYAFSSCENLSSVKLGGAKAIGIYAFNGCGNIYSLEIAGDVGSIGAYAFSDISRLKSVSVLGNTNSVGSYAFAYCYNLESAEFKGNVGTVGNSAFMSCGSLTSLTFGGNLGSLEENAFSSCTSLEKLVLPDSLTTIPDYAFAYCFGLREIRLPQKLTNLSRYAFLYCDRILLVYNRSALDLSVYDYFHSPIAVVTTEAKAKVEYVRTEKNEEFARIDGKWYFLNGLDYNYGYYFVPESFTVNGETITEFALAKYSATVWNLVIGTNVTSVPENAVSYDANIYYKGTAAEWKKIANVSEYVFVMYYKECVHEGEYEYWRYDENGMPTNACTELDDELWTTVKESTCTAEGQQRGVCPICKKQVTRTTGLAPHSIKDGKCTVCGVTAIVLTSNNIDGVKVATFSMTEFYVDITGKMQSANHSHSTTGKLTVKANAEIDISFDFTVSSEPGADRFLIYINGYRIDEFSGTDSSSLTIHLNAGDELSLAYEKDGSVSAGDDCVTINNFTVIYAEVKDNA